MDAVPDRTRSSSPKSRTPNHSPRLGPSRLSSSRIRSSSSSLWYRRKRAKFVLALFALLGLFFVVNYVMLLRLQHQQDRPNPNPKSNLSVSLQEKWNKKSNSKKPQKGNYARMLALAAHALAENKREPKDLWQEPLVPASSWTPCSDQRSWEPNEGSNGYILITANGGINQQRVAVCNAVVVARLLNSTLVIPKFMYSSVWRDTSQFRDIYQEEHFITNLTPDIRIVRELPKNLQSLDLEAIGSVVTDVDMGKEAKPSYYLKHILPIILKNQVVHFVGFGNRLAFDPIPFELQRLRGQSGLIGPLDRHLVGPFGELNMEKGEKNSKKASKYLALHLRFEIDMVSHSLCEFGGGEEERKELEAYREIHFPALALLKKTTKLPSPSELRAEGLCPLTPEESILMLAALGFNRKTNIFVAGSNLYGGRSRLIALTSLYPKLVTKENLLSSAELEPFANYSSQAVLPRMHLP
ncbi:hypothetical protein TSUD_203090 [Trifolium subterraneum]|uniref:O-fucosyltransferase family protein n=1 Tax=Trifolium subterraneum TaxID=3900 RepID=A0A2Z6M0I2_TRISU|nr:hypothetical protein TSUD_203090 [Trifolium subterraneum]